MPVGCSMTAMSKKNCFTLTEVAIVAALFSVVGIALVSSFSSGLKVWKKVYTQTPQDQVAIFFDKVSLDLRSAFNHNEIKFLGNAKRISFPGLIITRDSGGSLKKSIGEVVYYWDESGKKILRITNSMSDLYKESRGKVYEVLNGVDNFEINYYSYSPEEDEYFWNDCRQDGILPLSVTITVSFGYEDNILNFTKTISLPAGRL